MNISYKSTMTGKSTAKTPKILRKFTVTMLRPRKSAEPAPSDIEIKIRKADVEEFQKLHDLDELCFGHPSPDEKSRGVDSDDIWRHWTEFKHPVFVAVHEQEPGKENIVGVVVATPSDAEHYWWIHKVATHPEYQNLGIATKLLETLKEGHPTKHFFLSVDPNNLSAKRAYTKNGFEVHRFVPEYYGPHRHRDIMVYHSEERLQMEGRKKPKKTDMPELLQQTTAPRSRAAMLGAIKKKEGGLPLLDIIEKSQKADRKTGSEG